MNENATMIPEGVNVSGVVTSMNDLQPVFRAVRSIIPPTGRVYIYRSGFNGVETLHVKSDQAEFESTELEAGGQYLLNGAVGGAPDEVVEFVRMLSESLAKEGVKNSLEVHDDEHRLIVEIKS